MRSRTDAERRAVYRRFMQIGDYPILGQPEDFVVRAPNLPTQRSLDVCLARLRIDGSLELIGGGWEELLGYRRGELYGRPLLSLFAGEGDAVDMLSRLLDPAEPDPVSVDLRRGDGGVERLQVYRRFDEYDAEVFVLAVPRESS